MTLPLAATHIDAGGFATCASLLDGRVSCWGVDGDSTSTPLYYGGAMFPTGVSGIAVADAHGFLVPGDSLVLRGASGDVLQFVVSTAMEPATELKLSAAIAIAAGANHDCAIVGNSGDVYCWGANDKAQLGQRVTAMGSEPSPQKLNGVQAISISAGDNHCCALTMLGGVSCWGSNDYFESGGPVAGSPVLAPGAVIVPGNPAISRVIVGPGLSAALTTGHLFLWGSNYGHVISDSAADQPTPSEYLGLSDVETVAFGVGFACALLTDGHLKCWGNNSNRQLGDGTDVDKTSPVDVAWP